MIFDAHTHAYNAKDRSLIVDRSSGLDHCLPEGDPNKWELKHDGSVASLVREEQKAGIELCVVLPVTGRADRVGELNRWMAEQASQHPCLIPFGSLIPASPSLEEDLQEILDLGLRGIKIHPVLQHLDILSPEAHVLWDLLEEAGLPLVLDSMFIQGLSRYKPHMQEFVEAARAFETGPMRIAEMARMHPGLLMVAAHTGSLFGWDALDPLYPLSNVYFDLSFTSGILPDEDVMDVIRKKGTDHIVFGTDTPWRSPIEERRWFERLPLDDDAREAIGWRNLDRLLSLGYA
jgi:hypothetical protein